MQCDVVVLQLFDLYRDDEFSSCYGGNQWQYEVSILDEEGSRLAA